MIEEQAFLNSILADLKNETVRLIYADWLEERGDDLSAAKAEFLRLQSAWLRLSAYSPMKVRLRKRLRQCGQSLDPDWIATVSMLLIENCYERLILDCPAKWEHLQITGEPWIRVCGACKKQVRYCPTVRMARHAGYRPFVVSLCVKRKPGDVPDYLSMQMKHRSASAFLQCKRRQQQENAQAGDVLDVSY